VVFGHDVVERLAQECAAGGRTTRLQLLASPFYEAVKREIGRTPVCEAEKRRALAAADDQCRRAAGCSAPANIVVELRAAVAKNWMGAVDQGELMNSVCEPRDYLAQKTGLWTLDAIISGGRERT
jgi:hypothetical protein